MLLIIWSLREIRDRPALRAYEMSQRLPGALDRHPLVYLFKPFMAALGARPEIGTFLQRLQGNVEPSARHPPFLRFPPGDGMSLHAERGGELLLGDLVVPAPEREIARRQLDRGSHEVHLDLHALIVPNGYIVSRERWLAGRFWGSHLNRDRAPGRGFRQPGAAAWRPASPLAVASRDSKYPDPLRFVRKDHLGNRGAPARSCVCACGPERRLLPGTPTPPTPGCGVRQDLRR